jgi:rhamnose utilization protein RhaD (predicted bifunctional aldolase and dehydrogenase)
MAIVSAGSLYPDHVVFLGPAVAVLERCEGAFKVSRPGAAVVAVPGQGTLVRSDLSSGAQEMVRALGLVVARIPDDANITYLSEKEEDELLVWEAEKYRHSFSR